MILEVIQTKSAIKQEYDILIDNQLRFKAEASPVTKYFECCLKDLDGSVIFNTDYDIKIHITNIIPFKWIFGSPKLANPCNIYGNNEKGIFLLSTTGLFKSMYVITLNNSTYNCYTVSKGDYNYVAVYDGDKQIALIEKVLTVTNNLDTYKIFLLDHYKERAKLLSLFTVYYDNWNYSSRGSMFYGTEYSKEWTYSRNNDKYDPDWKSKNSF